MLSGFNLNNLNNLERDKDLSGLTSLGVGGKAEYYIEPESIDDFKAAFKLGLENKLKIYILGGGSNVIFPDDDIKALVISTKNKKFNKILFNDNNVRVQAGCSLARLAAEAAKNNLSGLEFAVGIPGTVGGAIFGNAGAGGHGIAELVSELIIIDDKCELKKLSAEDFSYGYRNFEINNIDKNKILILECVLKLHEAERELIDAEVKRYLSKRVNQPLGRSAGCTFKNPEIKNKNINNNNENNLSAGKLLDDCGCKGLECGDAVVSENHANFILNRGRARSEDIINLIKICQERVFNRTGVMLEPEIKFMAL